MCLTYGCRRSWKRTRSQPAWSNSRCSRWRTTDGLITNFHLPESTLIMLVAAFCGYENTMRAYEEAVKQEYRFFSFGDAMFIH